MRTFRSLIRILACTTVAAASSAFAADMPVKAPVAPLPPPFTWTGFYFGGHAGYGWGDTHIALSSSDPGLFGPAIADGAIPGRLSTDAKGFLGGVQVGYNVQSGTFVYGIEGDVAYARLRGSASVTTSLGGLGWPTLTTTHQQELDWFATARLRIGMLPTPTLLAYVTGGLAVGGVDASTNVVIPAGGCAANVLCGTGSTSDTLFGWTAGGGLEAALGRNWTVKIEYLYFDLGDADYTVVSSLAGTPNWTASAKFAGHILRGGLNWRF